MALEIGNKAPALTLRNQDDTPVKLSDFAGRWLVMFAYPKDNTSG